MYLSYGTIALGNHGNQIQGDDLQSGFLVVVRNFSVTN